MFESLFSLPFSRRGTEGSSNPPKLRRNASAAANMSSLGLQSAPAPGSSRNIILIVVSYGYVYLIYLLLWDPMRL